MDFRLVSAQDIAQAYALEVASFPADEAASLDALQSRQRLAPQLFLGAYSTTTSPSQLIAFTCSTLTSSPTLTHDSMSTHEQLGNYIAIHSVCVSPSHRRQGVALALLGEYLSRARKEKDVKGAVLITKQGLVQLYEKAGFVMRGESEVVHGKDTWYEMGVDFAEVEGEGEGEEALAVKAEEEEEDEGEVRNPGKKLGSRAVGSIEAVVDKETGLNSADLFCPRAECRCLLLRKGAGKFVRGHKSDFELPALPHLIDSPPASTASTSSSAGYWSIPSPLTFENIGFSRNAQPPSSSSPSPAATAGATIKYLICADCDHGPLGWHDTEGRDLGLEVEEENEGAVGKVREGREFLLAVERVRYRS